MTEHELSLRCPKCKHHLVADVDIEAWVTKKAYDIIQDAIDKKNVS